MRAESAWTPGADGLRLAVKAQPGAKREGPLGFVRDAEGRVFLRLGLKAPAQEDRANRALIAYLAKELSLPKSAFRFLSGEKSRWKIVAIAGDGADLGAACAARFNAE